jgi:tetratricopeptide (TPR) repeat protein
MSAGELFELVRPAALLISALISTWVLASARKRFPLYQSFLWAIGTLSLTLIVLPLYLSAIVFRRRRYLSLTSRFVIPLLYSTVVLSSIGIYEYRSNRSVDAYLARATQAKVSNQRAIAIKEYKRALELEDDPHIHKLLAIELADSGYSTDAISEFRLAQQGGEPDDSIHFWLALLLERINHNGEARLEFQEFLLSSQCMRSDYRCDLARQRVEAGTR